MVVRFGKWGKSLALRLPAPIVHRLGVSNGSALALAIENERLVIRPIKSAPRYDLETLVAGMTDDNRHDDIATGGPVGEEIL